MILTKTQLSSQQLLLVTWEDPLVMSLFGKKESLRELQGDKLVTRLEMLQRTQESLLNGIEDIVQASKGILASDQSEAS